MLAIDQVEAIVRDAAALACGRFGSARSELKPDGSLVTDADRAVQALVVGRLRALEPDPKKLLVIAEEPRRDGTTDADDPLEAECVAAVDPIDGTTAFATGLPLWGISVGLLEGGRPTAGVLHMPLLGGPGGWRYRVDRDGPATRNGAPLAVRPFDGWHPTRQVAVPSGVLGEPRLPKLPGKLRSLGSTAHHLALVAAGGLDAALLGSTWLWDIAAAAALVERAGGVLEDLAGRPVDWPRLLRRRHHPGPLLAGSRAAVASLRARLAPSV